MDSVTKQRLNRGVTWTLAIALVLSIGGVAYVGLGPGTQGDPFTEFYILDADGETSEYPTNLTVGETGELIVGITNNEHRTMSYTVVLELDGEQIASETTDVGDGSTWEDEFTVTPTETGEKQLDILLYTGSEPDDDVYRDLHLPITVTE